MKQNGAPLIFVSHAAVDEEIARSLKSFLMEALHGVEIFVSSDPSDLPLGDPCVAKILEALKRAKIVLLLATERGLNRPWVWFETGRTWFSDVRCIPCCLGKIRKSSLPAPFDFRQATNLDETKDLDQLVAACGKEVGIIPGSLDLDKIIENLIRLEVRAEERQKVIEDQFSYELGQEVERTMRALDPGSQEALRLVLKYGELTQRVARDKVQATGKLGSNTLLTIGLANHTGWLIKTAAGPFPSVSNEEDRYAVLEKMRPYIAAWFEKNP